MNRRLPILLSLPLTAVLAAQQPNPEPLYALPTRGIMTALQAGIVWQSTPATIALKREGQSARLDTFVGRRNVPEFTGSQILAAMEASAAQLSGELVLAMLEIDAMSSGNDILPLVADGTQDFRIAQANAVGWAVLYLAVEPDPGEPFETGDVLGYYFDNPSFPQQVRSGVRFELLKDDLVPGGSLAPPPAGTPIAALDVSMGLLDTNDGPNTLLFPIHDKLYFSVTTLSALLLNAVGLQLYEDGGAAVYGSSFDGATIFVATFDRTTGDCMTVEVHMDGDDLQLAATANREIDALAIGAVSNDAPPLGPNQTLLQPGTKTYVFSTAQQEVEELMVLATPHLQGPEKRRLRSQNGRILVGPGGTVRGRVRGVCSQDPDSNGGGSCFGVPTAAVIPDPATNQPQATYLGLSLSAHATAAGDEGDSFTLTGVLSGWGIATPGDSVCYLAVEHLGSVQYYPLGLRLASDHPDSFEFVVALNYPWVNQGGGFLRNQYKVWVVQAALPLVWPYSVTFSIPELLDRLGQ